MASSKIVLYGGNGFVGTAMAKELVARGVETVSVSRSGNVPLQLVNSDWAEDVSWLQGDACDPDIETIHGASVLVCLVGSPPIPTFSKQAFSDQLHMNSQPALSVINAAAQNSISRVLLLGAHIPNLINSDRFAYAQGKRLSLEAAMQFVEQDNSRAAVVLQPSAIYGTRYSVNGKPLHLGAFMRPISRLQRALPDAVNKILPQPFVSVRAVARTAVEACLNDKYANRFTVIGNSEIR